MNAPVVIFSGLHVITSQGNGLFYTLRRASAPESAAILFQGDDADDFASVFDARCGVDMACTDYNEQLNQAEYECEYVAEYDSIDVRIKERRMGV